MNDEKTQAEAALRDATEHHQAVKRDMRAAITDEQKKIEARYEPLLVKARDAKTASKVALDEINVRLAASNPLIGRRVHQPARTRTWRGTSHGELFGVIEAFEPGDSFTGSRPPQAGKLVIRILKANGEPSLRIKEIGMYNNPDELPYGWNLVETDTAEPKES